MGWAWGLKKFSSLPPEIEFQWNDFRLESEIQQVFSWSLGHFSSVLLYWSLLWRFDNSLSLQLALGLFLREPPLFALATAATAVGIWTAIPYAAADCTALFIYLRHCYSTRSQSSLNRRILPLSSLN